MPDSQILPGAGTTTPSGFDQHPRYAERAPDWSLLNDCYEGDRRIKSRTTKYLPTTGGMRALGLGNDTKGAPKEGQALYDAYKARARFPDWTRSTVVKLVGLLTREDAVIEVPKRLEDLVEHATPDGESLQTLLKKIFQSQILRGRLGILIDVDEERNLPYFAVYNALSIVNWDDTIERQGASIRRRLEFVLLDESRYERPDVGDPVKGRAWVWKKRARVLTRGAGGKYQVTMEVDGTAESAVMPTVQGKTLEEIPFIFVNAMDLLPDPDMAPLIGLAGTSLQAYRTDADYRQALFNQGQDTLVIQGATLPGTADPRDEGAAKEPTALVGAGAVICVPEGGDAKFIGVESEGLSELRTAMTDLKEEAGEYGGELLSAAGGGESGEALATRIGARTANLPGIAKAGAKALQDALRIAAVWAGADPDEVKVEPNLDWVEDQMMGEEATQWIGAKRLGFPISMRSLHEMAQKRDATSRTYEEELEEISKEEDDLPENMRGSRGADPGEGAGEPGEGEGEDEDDDAGQGNNNPGGNNGG